MSNHDSYSDSLVEPLPRYAGALPQSTTAGKPQGDHQALLETWRPGARRRYCHAATPEPWRRPTHRFRGRSRLVQLALEPRHVGRRVALACWGLAALVAVSWLGAVRLEIALRLWIEATAARRGLTARMDAVHIRPWRPLAISGLRLDKPGVGTLSLERVVAAPRFAGARQLGLRLMLGRATFTGPAGVTVEMAPTQWDVAVAGSIHAELRAPVSGLEVAWTRVGHGDRFEGRARELPAAAVVTIRRAGLPLIDPGLVTGAGGVGTGEGTTRFEVNVRGAGARVAALANGDGAASGRMPGFGEPEDVTVGLEGLWRAEDGSLDLHRWRLASDAATLSGKLQLDGLRRDPAVSLSLQVERVDFARLFRASGLEQPLGVARPGGGEPTFGAMGSVALQASACGRLADASSFSVSQHLEFTPPRLPLPALERLRGDFVHVGRLRNGGTSEIHVSPRSADFVALGDVPPLFVRTLLLGEDAAFFGHRGLDLQALPEAVLTNWTRGGVVRGASTITQQLAKNLFLSNDRHLGRKMQELCLALLLEATLDKARILEIYLNVIEWGPDLFGLRPAARRYFGHEPRELTPKQMAFLVALVPGPVRYQRSFADGTPSPAFQRLVDRLLAKLRSVDALSEAAYSAALAESLVVAPAAVALEDGPRSMPVVQGP